MASLNEGLVLALALDDDDSRLADLSGSGNNGTLKGAITLVPDDLFGACLRFSGPDAQIVVADHPSLRLTGDMTLLVWVYLEEVPPAGMMRVRVLGKGGVSQDYGLWYNVVQKQWAFRLYGTEPLLNVMGEADEIKSHTWYHLVGVRQGEQAFLYLNGAQIGAIAGVRGTPFTNVDPLTLGFAGHNAPHRGLLARARVYNRALSPEEIKRVMEQDRLALPAFRKSHPVDFSLYDDHNQYVLYIDDEPAGHRLHLELHNTAAKDLQLAKMNDTASADNHHFELRFRAGTLSNKTLDLLKDPVKKTEVLGTTADWDFFVPTNGRASAGDTISLYLLYRGTETLFKPNAKRQITFAHVSASATGGSRGTQVELRPHQITFVNATVPISGSRVQTLHIANQRGLKEIPLHVDFIGPNRILNDGAAHPESELQIQLMNVTRVHAEHATNPQIPFRVADQSKNIAASQFILTFEVQDTGQDRPWALCQASELNDFKISADLIRQARNAQGVWTEQRETAIFDSAPTAGALGESRQWTLTPKKNLELYPGDYLLFKLAGLKSSLPSGMANLYLHYENIPGYWDGQFTCQVEKAPLLYLQQSVGIGTSAPQAKLHVNGGLRVENEVSIGGGQKFEVDAPGVVGGRFSINANGNVGIATSTPEARLHINTPGLGAEQAGFRMGGEGKFVVDAPGVIGGRLAILGNGNVGIGAAAPAAKLEVNGGIKLSAWGNMIQFIDAKAGGGEIAKGTVGAVSYVDMQIGFPGPVFGGKLIMGRWTTSNPSTFEELMRVQSDGNVGIGTTAVANRLQINSVFHGSAGYGLTVSQEQYGANVQIKRRVGEGGIGLVVDNNEAGDANTLLFLVRNNVKAYPNSHQDLFVIRRLHAHSRSRRYTSGSYQGDAN